MDQTAIAETQNDRDPKSGKFISGNRASVRHGVFSARVPKIRGIKRLNRELEKLRDELESNVPEITPQKALLISQVVRSELQIRLIEIYTGKYGVLKPDQFRKNCLELHPALANSYLSFLNSQRAALQALGIGKEEAKDVIDVRSYAAEKYGGKKAKKK